MACVKVFVIIILQALLKSSEMYEEATKHAASHGIIIEGARIDLPKMMEQKDKAVDGLTKGIEFLFKKNKASSHLPSSLRPYSEISPGQNRHDPPTMQALGPVVSLQHCILLGRGVCRSHSDTRQTETMDGSS